MELYYGTLFMKRIPGMPGPSPEIPGIAGIPWTHPWDPRGRPWDPRGRHWEPWARPWDPLGTSLRPPRDAPGTPLAPQGTISGPQKRLYLHKYTVPEALDCCVRACLSGSIA